MALTVPANGTVAAISAAELASRIEIPIQLPPRYDGEPIRHLSQSSIGLYQRCPESFRRRYICGEKGPSNGPMFLGSMLDKTLAHYYRTRIDTGEGPSLAELQQFYKETWPELREQEEGERGIDWSELRPEPAFEIGLGAIDVALTELVPKLGRPVAVQRKLEFSLTPDCEWVVQGFLDLETEAERPDAPEPTKLVVDTKVKRAPLQQNRADTDLQASIYLTGRWIEGNPAEEFWFAQLLRPGARRAKTGSKITATRRTPSQMRMTRMRIARVAEAIVASYERYGPERPWSFAEPGHWSCDARFCDHFRGCPAGAGA